MKALLSFVLAALIVNACVRAGDSAWRFYQLRDAVEHETRYGDVKTTSLLRKRILELAFEHDIELSADDILVERRGQETYVSVTYTESIPLVPRAYAHEQDYDITMTVQPSRPIVDDKK
jgi:hypothetical protein